MGRPGSISTDVYGDVKIVRLVGEHDVTTAPDVQAKLDALADDGGLVVSLDEIEFLDSSVIHALLAVDRRLTERNRRLVVQAAAQGVVDSVLKPTGVIDEVVWTESLDVAIEVARRPMESMETNPQ